MPSKRRAIDSAGGRHVLDLRVASAAHDLSRALWTSWCEAAAVTLNAFHGSVRSKPCTISPARRDDLDASITWADPDARTQRSHANTTDATEMGAYAVATLAVNAVDGWRVIARTPTESGADVWMVQSDEESDAQVRLEVSGVAKGSGEAGLAVLRKRLDQKVAQVQRGNRSEPGVAAVVGFEQLRILISEMAQR